MKKKKVVYTFVMLKEHIVLLLFDFVQSVQTKKHSVYLLHAYLSYQSNPKVLESHTYFFLQPRLKIIFQKQTDFDVSLLFIFKITRAERNNWKIV